MNFTPIIIRLKPVHKVEGMTNGTAAGAGQQQQQQQGSGQVDISTQVQQYQQFLGDFSGQLSIKSIKVLSKDLWKRRWYDVILWKNGMYTKILYWSKYRLPSAYIVISPRISSVLISRFRCIQSSPRVPRHRPPGEVFARGHWAWAHKELSAAVQRTLWGNQLRLPFLSICQCQWKTSLNEKYPF